MHAVWNLLDVSALAFMCATLAIIATKRDDDIAYCHVAALANLFYWLQAMHYMVRTLWGCRYSALSHCCGLHSVDTTRLALWCVPS